jgi:hypothetical protein
MTNGQFLDQEEYAKKKVEEEGDAESKRLLKAEDLLATELSGRVAGLKREVRQLNDRSRVNRGLNSMRTGKMRTLQMVNNVLRYVYLVVLAVLLVLFARERWPEYYEDRDWSGMLTFVATGTFLLLAPYYLLDAIVYVHGWFAVR